MLEFPNNSSPPITSTKGGLWISLGIHKTPQWALNPFKPILARSPFKGA
jgi:hypothetical protein